MTTKHDPGPWKLDEWGKIINAKGEHVVSSGISLSCGYRSDKKPEENDRLIAAAPCLFDALCQWANAEKTNDAQEMENARAARDAAIAKATGEQT